MKSMFRDIFLQHNKNLVKLSRRTLLIVYKTIHHLKKKAWKIKMNIQTLHELITSLPY